jgi:hypothetical protein
MVEESASPGVFTLQGGPSWVRLLRPIRLAFDLRKLVLAALGLILLQAGWDLLDVLFPGSSAVTPARFDPARNPTSRSGELLDASTIWEHVRSAVWRITEPARMLASPLTSLFSLGNGAGWFLHALLASLWVIVVWGILGGAISRMALVQISRLQGLGTLNAVRFALRFAAPLILTPLCPLLGVGTCALVCAAFGLLYWLPYGIGGVVGGILLFVPLILGLIMAIMLIGLMAGWPLMQASVAAEAEDTLDALSRCFSYLNQRLGKFVVFVAIAWLIGIPGLLLVDIFAGSLVHLATWGLSLSAPASSLAGLDFPIQSGAAIPQTATAIQNFWRGFIALLAQSWIYVYFWTAASFIYLMLRLDVDGTSWNDVKEV